MSGQSGLLISGSAAESRFWLFGRPLLLFFALFFLLRLGSLPPQFVTSGGFVAVAVVAVVRYAVVVYSVSVATSPINFIHRIHLISVLFFASLLSAVVVVAHCRVSLVGLPNPSLEATRLGVLGCSLRVFGFIMVFLSACLSSAFGVPSILLPSQLRRSPAMRSPLPKAIAHPGGPPLRWYMKARGYLSSGNTAVISSWYPTPFFHAARIRSGRESEPAAGVDGTSPCTWVSFVVIVSG